MTLSYQSVCHALEKTGKFKNNAGGDAMYDDPVQKQSCTQEKERENDENDKRGFLQGCASCWKPTKRILHFARVGMTISTVMPFVRDFVPSVVAA